MPASSPTMLAVAMDHHAFCRDCGRELGPPVAGEPRPPCPVCFGKTVDVKQAIRVSGGGGASLAYEVRINNDAVARVVALVDALAEVEAQVAAHSTHNAQEALKRALEAIHELGDCRRAGEWKQDGWSPDEIGLWIAHIGARNAAHHNSLPIVVRVGRSDRDDGLRWDVQPQALKNLRARGKHCERQATEYSDRLHDKHVLPALRDTVKLISAAIPTL
jgi:hypothetical protein